MKNTKEKIIKKVDRLCKSAGLEYLIILPGKSRWSVKENKHIREVAYYHKETE